MPRPISYAADQILDAVVRTAAEHGPKHTTIARIAARLGAPSGSIYHRFASRSALLGEAWLRAAEAFQAEFVRRLGADDAEAAGRDALAWFISFVRTERQQAQLLLLHRREDFLAAQWPASLKRRARELGALMNAALNEIARRLVGRADANTLRLLTFALAEAPLAAVKRHLEANEAIPRIVDVLIEHTFQSTLNLIRGRI